MPDSCFVIMPFNPDFDEIYNDAIKPAVVEVGLKCIRVNEISGTGNIVRRIVESIHEAKIVIADLTGKNANVFYELGMAHALGNNVIVLAQNIRQDVPFDVGNYRVIQYENTIRGGKQLRAQIQDSIKSMDEWTTRPSNPVQDFLPKESRPVHSSEYKKIQDECERLTRERAALQAERDAAVAEHRDGQKKLETLRQENTKLQGLKFFLETMFKAIGKEVPEFAAGANFDQEWERFMEQVAYQGEVEIPVTLPTDRGETKRQKITFRKVEKTKE